MGGKVSQQADELPANQRLSTNLGSFVTARAVQHSDADHRRPRVEFAYPLMHDGRWRNN